MPAACGQPHSRAWKSALLLSCLQPRCPASACCFCVRVEHVLWLFLQMQVPACPGLVVDCTHVVFRLPACGKFGECWHRGMSRRSIKGTCGWVWILLSHASAVAMFAPVPEYQIILCVSDVLSCALCYVFACIGSTDACALQHTCRRFSAPAAAFALLRCLACCPGPRWWWLGLFCLPFAFT